MVLLCKYKELIHLINLLNEIEKEKSLKFLYSQLSNRKNRLIRKSYKSLFDYNKFDIYKPKRIYKKFITNSLDSILEFVNKSLDLKQINSNKLTILLHLNRLIAFNFDRVLDAGLRNTNQDTKDDYRKVIFDTFKLNMSWDLELLQINFCFEDLVKHFLYISSIKPFRAFNIQTAFAWGLVLEKVCISNFYTFTSIRYIPLLTWSILFLLHHNDYHNVYNEENLMELVIDFFVDKLNKFKDSITLPDYFYDILNKRQILAVLFILKKGCITRREYAKHFRVSFMTAFRDLRYMLNKGILAKMGQNNKTHYCFSNSIKFLS